MVAEPETALGELFDAHAADLGRYLSRRIGVHVAEDLVAETFAQALRGWSRYQDGAAGRRGWLFGIATNLLRRHVRTEERQWRAMDRAGRRLPPRSEGVDVQAAGRVDAEQTVSDLAVPLARLSDGDRDVLLLTAWAQFSTAEIAAALDIPEGTVRSRLHRARKLLKEALSHARASLSTSEEDQS